jgi:hypothetical protein
LRDPDLQRINSGNETAGCCALDFLYVDLSRRERDQSTTGHTARWNASGDAETDTGNFRRVTELR